MADAKINIKIQGDASGAVTALGRVKNAFGSTVKTLNGVRSAIGNVMKAFGIFGLAMQGITMLIDGFKKVHEWIKASENAAREFAREMEKNRYETSIKKAADAYEELNKKLARTNQLEKDRNAILDKRTAQGRDIEDAKLALAKEKEIAALDPMAEDYGERKKEIETRYAREASRQTAQRATEDSQTALARLRTDLAAKDKAITAADKNRQGELSRRADAMAKRDELQKLRPWVETGALRGYDLADIDERIKNLTEVIKKSTETANKRTEEIQKLQDQRAVIAENIATQSGASLNANMRDAATQAAISRQEREDAAAKAKKEQEEKRKAEEAAAKEREREEAQKAKEEARAKAKAEDEERRKVISQKSEKASMLSTFADRLAATDGVSSNRLTALGLGSGVAPRQSQIANDVKNLVKLMKDEIEATKAIADGGDQTATFAE